MHYIIKTQRHRLVRKKTLTKSANTFITLKTTVWKYRNVKPPTVYSKYKFRFELEPPIERTHKITSEFTRTFYLLKHGILWETKWRSLVPRRRASANWLRRELSNWLALSCVRVSVSVCGRLEWIRQATHRAYLVTQLIIKNCNQFGLEI